MIGLIGRYSAAVNEFSLVKRCALLIAAVLLAFAAAAPIAWSRGGAASLAAAGLASGVCCFAGLIAVFLATRGRGTSAAVGWVLAGDGIAMALPLLVAVSAQRSGHALHAAGLFGWVVVFFLVTLVAKTLLVAPLASPPSRSQSDRSHTAPAQSVPSQARGELPKAGI